MTLPIPLFSRINRTLCVIAIVCLLTAFAGVLFVAAHNGDNTLSAAFATASARNASDPQASDPQARARIAENFGRLPLSFEINKGQIDQPVKFLSRGPGYDLFLTANEAVLRVPKAHAQADNAKGPAPGKGQTPPVAKRRAPAEADADANVREGTVLRLKLLGANDTPQVAGQDELPGKVNYFVGNDPAHWRRNIPTYRKAYFKDVYPGIDVVYYGNQQELEYDLIVAAGANPKLIRFNVEGADKVRLDKTGKLLLTLKYGEVSLNKPVIFQLDKNGSRREVKGGYSISGNEVRYKLDSFDSSKPLVIDPVLSYSTLLGSTNNDNAFGIAVDSQGSAYVTGRTDGLNFPTTAGAFKTTSNRDAVFVTKLDPNGSALVYSTYLSGLNGFSNGNAIAVDASGNAYVTGATSGSDFPLVNGLKTSSTFFKTTDSAANWNNQNSGLVGSVNTLASAPSAPNTIYASTTDGIYRSTDGGAAWTKAPSAGLSSPTVVSALAVDPSNSSVIYLAQFSSLFRSADGGNNWAAINGAPLGTGSIACIAFDPATSTTMYVGGSNGVFKSTNGGNNWITQNNFGVPGTPNVRVLAIDPTAPLTIYAGTSSSGFFKSINGAGVWTAMNNGMGGTSATSITALAIDPSDTATIYTGHGSSGTINKTTNGATSWTPLTNGVPTVSINSIVATSTGVFAATSGAGVIKTTNGGANWTNANAGLWSTFVNTLVRNPADAAVLYAGTSPSSSSDAFVTKLNPSGSGLLFSTFLGGSNDDIGNGIALDASGKIVVAGATFSANFPVANAVQPGPVVSDSCVNGFVTSLDPSVPAYTFSTYLGGAQCDLANAVATDSSGNIYVTGETNSPNFPTANPFQPAFAGATQFERDAFVTKLTSSGAFVYSTFLGGTGFDSGAGIAADASGNAYVAGATNSLNFPTMNPVQPANSSQFSTDAFLTKFNPQGSALVYSTYLGGTGNDEAQGVAVDAANNAYLTGWTASLEFPLVAGSLRTRSPLYKSTDAAASWSNDNYGFTGSIVNGIAIDPTRPSTVYAGSPQGVFKSTNGGRTWAPINNGLGNLVVIALVIDPVTPSTLYVATGGFVLNATPGIYKSTDGGASWNLRSNGMTSTGLISLAIDPVTPNTLYAGVQNGGGSRIYKTTDGADNWALTGNVTLSQPAALVIDPLNHNTIFAADSTSPGGIFKSTDAGVTFQPVGGNQVGPFPRTIAISPFTAGLMYADAAQGLFKSTDGGNNWTPVPNRAGKVVFDPVTPSTIYLLSSSQFSSVLGIFKSIDAGQTWLPIDKGLNQAQAWDVAIDPSRPSTLYLATTASAQSDAFVTKFSPSGNALIYSTLLGGPTPPQTFTGVNAQAFGIAVDSVGNAYVTGVTSAPGFLVSASAFQPFLRGGNDAFVSKLSMSFLISGQILDGGGVPVSGAEIVLSDGASVTSIFTENDGTYQFSRLREGGTFTVTASKPHFTLTPPSQTFNNLTSDKVLNFTATATGAAFHTISGKVSENGNGLPNVTVTLSGSQPGVRLTDSNGNYSFELAGGGDYTVTPSVVGFTFGPASQTFNNLSAPQTANFTASRQSFVVTNANNHGTGSLREAIINANATLGADTIVFNIPGPGVKTINLLTALPEIIETVTIDATTQPGYAGTPLVELDGLGIPGASGLVIKAGGSTVRGLSIGNFRSENALWINAADNNTIQANYIGVAADGTTLRQNQRGILITNSTNNVIGGTTAAARNVISGNQASGIEIGGTNNFVQGNYIGTNAAGTAELHNTFGVAIFSSQWTNNLIGGTAPGAGNLIAGNNNAGVLASGNNTTIQGNLIGTNAAGTSAVPNTNGILCFAQNVLVGGLTPAARNVISGSLGDGISIRGAGNLVQGNYIGTDITGTLALGNHGNGVVAGDGAVIGGTQPEARNIIAASGNLANVSLGTNSSGNAAVVQGNYIGTDVTGTRSLGSAAMGINVASNNNIIGGTAAGAGNVISGNLVGIQLGGFFVSGIVGNVIQGNLIGLNAAGTAALPNNNQGIAISEAVNSIIGGTQNSAANKIAFNGGPGVSQTGGNGNAIRGNAIFSNNGLGIDLGNNGVTANDINDADSGANQLQNFPEITSVITASNSTTIQGTLKSIPNTTFNIDFYSNAALDPSGNGEGAEFFNTTSVSTDGNGNGTINVTFTAALPAGRTITATATDPNGNTSEFSAGNGNGAAGSVQFSVSTMWVIEDIGVANVTVLRTGGSSGVLTVNYATANGTAIAGQDYTATSGTLTFNAGESSKTIQIPITDDSTTETDEAFTVTLSNTPTLENLGAPSILTVNIQDRSTVPFLTISSPSVIEGNTGTTTDMFFTVSLSAATGRTVSASFTTANFGAFGGVSCNNPGTDYEMDARLFTFQPGASTFTIPIKICGDTSAEANEQLRVVLSNASGATILGPQGVGQIVDDDVLELVLEENGPNPNQAAALDARLGLRDPFRVLIPDWLRPTEADQITRVAFFARNLQLNPGELSQGVIVRFTPAAGLPLEVAAEDVRSIPNSELTQVTVRLPNSLLPGTYTVFIRAHTRVSNTGTIRIVP
jgi:Calx-beta domain/Carboxypeptidase regulatory-like domain/Beta-propeller repeat/CarboxypepD_reg-like domain